MCDICVWCSSNSSAVFNVVTSTGRQTTMKRSACFKMALWLAAYNEFFAKGVSETNFSLHDTDNADLFFHFFLVSLEGSSRLGQFCEHAH